MSIISCISLQEIPTFWPQSYHSKEDGDCADGSSLQSIPRALLAKGATLGGKKARPLSAYSLTQKPSKMMEKLKRGFLDPSSCWTCPGPSTGGPGTIDCSPKALGNGKAGSWGKAQLPF